MACETLSRFESACMIRGAMQPADLLDPSRCEMIWTHLRDPLDGYLVDPSSESVNGSYGLRSLKLTVRPASMVSQKEIHLPTIHLKVLC